MPAPTHVTVSPRSFACDLATICAPTLADLKPASLFRYQPAPGQNGTAMAAAWHTLLASRGVTVRVLKTCPVTGAVLVYVYRPAQVAAILQRGDVQDFLQSEGYNPGRVYARAALPAALLRGGLPPRNRRVLGLPAGRCHRLHSKPRQKLYGLRLLEGLHRPRRCSKSL